MDLATAAQSINPCEADGNELPICASPEPPAVDAHAGHMQMADSEATAVEARGVIYLTITNEGDSADTLTGIQSPVAAKAEIHQTTMDANGTMKMRQVEAPLEILPGAQLQFEPAGYHIMLLDLQQELKVGDRFPISLTFAQSDVITVESEVRLPTE
jgi:copper(I)-binding protein